MIDLLLYGVDGNDIGYHLNSTLIIRCPITANVPQDHMIPVLRRIRELGHSLQTARQIWDGRKKQEEDQP